MQEQIENNRTVRINKIYSYILEGPNLRNRLRLTSASEALPPPITTAGEREKEFCYNKNPLSA